MLARLQLVLPPILLLAGAPLAPDPEQDDSRSLLEEAALMAEELEKMEPPYQMSMPAIPVVDELIEVIEQLDDYLLEHPDDLEALVLAARLERQSIRSPSVGERPDMSGVHQRLDRVLAASPSHAAAHHWKSRLHGELLLASEDPVSFEPENLNAAIDHGSRAVELAPENPAYRENLALLLVENGEPDKAIKLLGAVANGKHVLFGILSDFAALPIPPGAVPSKASTDALTLATADADADRYARLRTRLYVLAGTAKQVERFYAGHWPDFRPLQVKTWGAGDKRAVEYRQWVAREGESWRVAADETELPEPGSMILRGIVMNVAELRGQPRALLERLVPEEVLDRSADNVFTLIRLINHRPYLEGWEELIETKGWVPSSAPVELEEE